MPALCQARSQTPSPIKASEGTFGQLFKKIVSLKFTVTERWGVGEDRERQISHRLVHSPDGCSVQSWTRVTPGVGSLRT